MEETRRRKLRDFLLKNLKNLNADFDWRKNGYSILNKNISIPFGGGLVYYIHIMHSKPKSVLLPWHIGSIFGRAILFNWKGFIKSILPAFVWAFLKQVFGSSTLNGPPVGFSGSFSSFSEARKECQKYHDEENYQGRSMLNATLEGTKKLRLEKLENSAGPTDIKALRLLASIDRILLEKESSATLNVVDFGGAMGNHFFTLRNLLPQKTKVRWTVLDLPKTVAAAKGAFLENGLSFESEFEVLKGSSIDLVLASSSLQYTPAPYDFLQKILGLQPSWVIIDRMPLIDGSTDKIVMQRVPPQIYEAYYPCHILAVEKLIHKIESAGYKKDLNWISQDEIITVHDQQINYRGIVFQKISST